MDQANETTIKAASLQPPPLVMSRIFEAPRETVFKAWSSADHVRNWFPPSGYTAPEAKVEMHVGGAFEVCMQAPHGERHWTRGLFTELDPPNRLVIDMRATDSDDRPIFRALTEVSFADAEGGTRMEVVQSYTVFQPEVAAPMIGGAPIGWRSTLDKFEAEVARICHGAEGPARSVVHAEFHINRTYEFPAQKVWRALTDINAKAKWFGGPAQQWKELERHMDVRDGGTERARGRWAGGVVSCFDAYYHDVIPNERLVYTYVMHLDDRKISVSLATLQLQSDGGKTKLKLSEQGAFLDGFDDAASRETGSHQLLDALEASLAN